MPDLLSQNLSTVQTDKQPLPATITAAASISPSTFLSYLSGSTQVQTIVPYVTGTHMIAVVAAATNSFATTGNIVGAPTTDASTTQPTLLVYDPISGDYLAVA